MADTSADDPRVQRTVAKVRDTVNRLMADEGLRSMTFARISRDSGVSRTTLYRHWDSPSALVRDVWARAAASNDMAHTDDLHADLVSLYASVRDVAESRTMRRALPALLDAAVRDPDLAATHAAFVADRRRPIVERLRQAVGDGLVDPDVDLDVLVDLMSGSVFYRQLMRRTRTRDDDIAAVVAVVLAGARRVGGDT